MIAFIFLSDFETKAQIPVQHIMCGTTEISEAMPETPDSISALLTNCTDPSSIRYLRVAIHFFLSESSIQRNYQDNCGSSVTNYTYFGPGNFTETSDGNGDYTYNGYKFANEIIANANNELENNADQWRKEPGQPYPSIPPQVPVRFILKGVYFHRDDAAYYNTQSAYSSHANYNIDGAQVLDAYFGWWPNASWGGQVNSTTNADKFCMINLYARYLQPNCRTWAIGQAIPTTISHEFYHTFNIAHTWIGEDNCLDTPQGFLYDEPDPVCHKNRANCWSFNENLPGCPLKPCDDWSKISNNIMDYNQYYPHATTPCQISRINTALSGNANTYIHSCNGCMPAQAFFTLPKEVILCAPIIVTLNGQGSFNENQYLIEICEVSDSDPDICTGGYYNSGWKSGKVSKRNLASLYQFKNDRKYKVKLTVANAECPGTDEWSQTFETVGCYALQDPCCFDLSVANPVTDNALRVSYHLPADGIVGFNLINLNTSQVYLLQSAITATGGDYQEYFDITGIPNGTYALQALYNGQPYTFTLIKQ